MKLKWMVITLLVPEFLVGKALSDYISVRNCQPRLQRFGDEDGVEWSMSYYFLADMGGVAVDFTSCPIRDQLCSRSERSQDHLSHYGRSHTELQYLQPAGEVGSANGDSTNSQSLAFATAEATESLARDVTGSSNLRTILESTMRPSGFDTGQSPSYHIPAMSQRSGDHSGTPNQEALKPITEPALRPIYSRSGDWDDLGTLSRQNKIDTKYIGQINWSMEPHNVKIVTSVLEDMRLDYDLEPNAQSYISTMYPGWYHNLSCLQGSIWFLDANQILLARELGIIAALPLILKDEPDDWNKGDFLVKGLAVLQVVWLIIQVTTRRAQGRASSQFEIVVLVFSTCTFLIYGLLWNKSQDVQTPFAIPASRYATSDEMSRLANYGPFGWAVLRKRHWISNNESTGEEPRLKSHPFSSVLLLVQLFLAACIALLEIFSSPHRWSDCFGELLRLPLQRLRLRKSSYLFYASFLRLLLLGSAP